MFFTQDLKHTLRRLTFTLLLGCCIPWLLSAETYTIHLYAPKVGNPVFWDMRAHTWYNDADGKQILRTQWADNDYISCEGEITVEGTTYAYYKYTFEWDQVPTRICFNLANKNTGNYYQEFTSKNFDLVDGKLYNFDWNENTPPADFDESWVNPSPQKNHTIYFADTPGFGADNTVVHGWGDNGDICLWNNSEKVEDTGTYVKIGDNYYPLYKYEYLYYGKLTEITFHTASVNISLNKGAAKVDDNIIVFANGQSMPYTGETFSAQEHTVYFADKYGWGEAWPDNYMHAQVFLGKTAGTDIVYGNWNNANQQMSKTGKYVKVGDSDSDYLPVYAFTFTSVQVPTEVHFYTTVTTNPIQETLRAEYVDGGIYMMDEDGQKKGISLIDNELIDEADVPESEHTIYYIDRQSKGSANTKVHVWNGLAPVKEEAQDDTMTDYAFVKENGNYFPIYKYTFKSKGTPTKLYFNQGSNKSINYTFVEGQFYPDQRVVDESEIYSTNDYTIYFADKYGWGGYTFLAIAGESQNLGGETMTFTNRYVKLGESDADYYPVFKRTFTYVGEPQKLYFYYEEQGMPKEGANETEFVDKKIYFATAEGNKQDMATVDLEGVQFLAFDDLPEVEHSVYLIDKTRNGADNTKVHVWNGGGAVQDWNDDDNMKKFGVTSIDGQTYPVYVYNFKWRGAPTKIIFRLKNQTTNLHYYEGGYYLYDGNALPTIVEDADVQESIKYTVYYIDYDGWGAESTLVHIWNENGALYEWGENKPTEPTGLFLKSGDTEEDYFPVYKYEFYADEDPTNVIFHKKNASLQTKDLIFKNNQVYYLNTTVQNSSLCQYDELELVPVSDLKEINHTIYFIDADNLGANNIKPHIWGATGDLFDWNHTESMKAVGRTNIDGTVFAVYKYDFSYKGKPIHIIFKYPTDRNTKDLDFVENGFYRLNGTVVKDVELEDFPTYTLYFADKYNWTADNTFVHVYSTINGVLSDWDSNDHMTDTGAYVEIDDWAYPLYSYTFRWEYLTDPDQVIFHTFNSKHEGTEGWPALIQEGKVYAFSGISKNSDYPTEVYELGDQLTYDEVFDKYGTIIRFADTGRWGASHTGIHLYDEGAVDGNGVRHNNAEFAWGEDPRMTETGKWVRINDLWAPVYEYRTMFKGAWGMNIHAFDSPDEKGNTSALSTQTGDCVIRPDRLYYFAGHNISVEGKNLSDLTFYDKMPEEGEEGYVKEGRWIYCHLGANQKYQAGYWEEPHAHFVNRPFDVTLLKDHIWFEQQLPDGRKPEQAAAYAADKMEPVPGMPTVYRIWCDDINKVNEIVFYHFVPARDHTSSNKYEEYLVRPYLNAEHPISIDTSISCENDPTTWASNAFTVGTHCMNQSYLTTEEYLKSWTANPDALYVIGNKGLVPTFDSYDHLCDPREGFEVESSEGVYIIPIGTISAENVVKFKFSLYDVGTISDTKCGQQGLSYSGTRGWATYNMGALGHDFPGDDLNSEWYHLHIWESPGMSREVHTFVNQTVRFNNYNQYGWRIEAGRGGVVANQRYWIVVDMHPDAENHRSVTLVPFNPQPTMEIKSGEITQRTLPLERARMLHDPNLLAGTSANGPVYFDRVNVYSIQAQLDEVGTDLFEEQEVTVEVIGEIYKDENGKNVYPIETETHTIKPLSVEYYVYLIYTDENGDEQMIAVDKMIGSQEDRVLNISNLVYSPDVRYALRAVYHDNIQERHFCSRFMYITTPPVVPDLYAPNVADVEGSIYTYDGALIGENDVRAIGGGANFTVPRLTNDDGSQYPYAYFPDLNLTEAEANGESITPNAAIIHADHHIADQHGKFLMMSDDEGDFTWSPYSDDEEYNADNNWSNFIFHNQEVPVFIDRLDTTGVGSKSTKANATFQFAAVYPFLIHDVSKEATAEPLLCRATNADINDTEASDDDNLGAFTIFTVSKASTAKATFQGTVTVSAIENVAVDETTDHSPIEYFTISGQRLPGQPTTPGLYIRRNANHAEKFIIK